MKARLSLLLTPILLFFCLPALAQRDSIPLNTIISKTNAVAEGRPAEKVYLHFDKPYYAVGDTIQFKVYLTNSFHQPSGLSKIVYVDIVSSRDTLIETKMISVKTGSAAGSIVLSSQYFKQDNYHIRAYTKWMSNFGPGYFFNRTISVGNATKEVNTSIAFKRSVSNNITQVSTSIVFKDAAGAPYADKKVNWTVSADDEIAKGKGNTDANGILNISFANTKSVDLSTAYLNTTLEAGGRKNYGQAFPLKSVAQPNDLQFFPEGGYMVNGLRSKVALKAVQPNGLSIGYTATVVDNTGATVATSEATHAGMGSFAITPEAGKSYKANVAFADGTSGSYDLPRIQLGGFTLSVNYTDTSRIGLRITADSTYFKNHQNKTYYIVGKTSQVIFYAAQFKLGSSVFSANIPTQKFPTGIMQLSLLTSTGQVVSERVVFVKHNELLGITLGTDKPSYTRRQKVRLNVDAKIAATPVAGDFSVSVIDESKVPVDENTETTLLTSLLLTSDLKGYIENPNYYFKQPNEKTAADLDLLMLTQGYRTYTYREIIYDKVPPLVYAPEQGIEITGTLRALNGVPVTGGAVTLQIPDKYFSTRTTTDADGRYRFSNLAFLDSSKIAISAKGNYNSKNMTVLVDGGTYPSLTKNPNYPDEKLNIDTAIAPYLQNTRKIFETSRTLNEVVIKASKVPVKTGPTHLDYSSLSALGMADHTVSSAQLKGCTNVAMCLQTMLFGVTYDQEKFYVSRDYNSGKRVPMSIFVKGMPMDYFALAGLNANEIESVEIFLKDELGTVNNLYQTNGVISINMRDAPKGVKISKQEFADLLSENVAKISPKGFNMTKAFYSPKYLPGSNQFGPDLRSTIYWDPKIATDAKTGKTFAEFYTGDGKGSYRVVIEGLDKDGHLGRAVYRFKIL